MKPINDFKKERKKEKEINKERNYLSKDFFSN